MAKDRTTEYLRRNLLVSSAYGVNGGLASALGRLRLMRRPPKWLVATLLTEYSKTLEIAQELAKHRDEVRK